MSERENKNPQTTHGSEQNEDELSIKNNETELIINAKNIRILQ